MQKIVPTQLSNYLQVVNYLGSPFEKFDNTTLNQKFDIQANAQLSPGVRPTLKGFTIGIGGHTSIQGVKGITLNQGIDHTSEDFGLYDHLPFVLRALNDDLTLEERKRYALRKIIPIDGVNYYAYYVKRLVTTDTKPTMTRRTVKDGEVIPELFVPTEKNLSPTPPSTPNTGVVTTSGVYLATSAIIPMPFTEQDVQELYNVAKILFGDERYAIISEFGFVTGVDAVVSVNTQAGQVSFDEIVSCQISAIISGHYELIFNSKGFDFSLEVGAVQPLLGTTQSQTATLKILNAAG